MNIKDISDIVNPDMENIKLAKTVSFKTFLKHLLIKHINAISSATAIILFIIVFLFLWFKIVVPWYIVLNK